MNVAQVLISLGNGCYEWREDASPQLINPFTVERGPCLLAFELSRMPAFRVGSVRFRSYTNQAGTFTAPARECPKTPCRPSTSYRKRRDLSQEEKEAVSSAQLKVIEEADGRLSFAEICTRAKCEFNQSTRRILQEHIEAKEVEMAGHGRAARYWARRAR